jgi:hypothetical protein
MHALLVDLLLARRVVMTAELELAMAVVQTGSALLVPRWAEEHHNQHHHVHQTKRNPP